MNSDAKIIAAAAIAGGIAGLRSMTAPAVVTQFAPASTLAAVTPILALGEAIADKLPFMPDRTKPVSLAFRAFSGGLSGAKITASKNRPAFWGAVIGAAAAIGASYGAFHLRRRIGRGLHIPDAVVALAEDAIAISAGVSILRSLTAEKPRLA
jgi:uncharacterized membrane protein